MRITADVVARAIVAAARETGEDPLIVGTEQIRVRCRHYAMHALHRVFPEYQKQALARFVGCPGRADDFWKNSRNMIFQKAHWWNAQVFQRVVDAVFAIVDDHTSGDHLRPVGQAGVVEKKILNEDRVPFRSSGPSIGKRKEYDMLRQAVENTARMPKGD